MIRHGQASFGATNYDALSDLGHRQSALAAESLRATGWVPDRIVTGTLARQIDTASAMRFDVAPEQHPGLNEYDFQDLLHTQGLADNYQKPGADRTAYFRQLRDTVHAWMRDEIADATETWGAFTARVEAARRFAIGTDARRVLVVSSGGVIAQTVAATLGGPVELMMTLNLQIKNTALTRFVYSKRGFYLHEFNSAPHFATADGAQMISYS